MTDPITDEATAATYRQFESLLAEHPDEAWNLAFRTGRTSAALSPVQRTELEQDAYQDAKERFFTASEHRVVVALRDRIVELGAAIHVEVPPGRNKALALTALEDVQMRANRAVFAPVNVR